MSENTTIRKVEIERLSVRSTKPFDAVVATLKAGIVQNGIKRGFRNPQDREGQKSGFVLY
jgi:hypothetical protein